MSFAFSSYLLHVEMVFVVSWVGIIKLDYTNGTTRAPTNIRAGNLLQKHVWAGKSCIFGH